MDRPLNNNKKMVNSTETNTVPPPRLHRSAVPPTPTNPLEEALATPELRRDYGKTIKV